MRPPLYANLSIWGALLDLHRYHRHSHHQQLKRMRNRERLTATIPIIPCSPSRVQIPPLYSPFSAQLLPPHPYSPVCIYAVINNFVGSGSVTYECEGQKQDCQMIRGLEGTSTTSRSSAGIVAGVVVSLLLVVTIVIIFVVWIKRRDKNLKPADNDTNTTSLSTLPPSLLSPRKLHIST